MKSVLSFTTILPLFLLITSICSIIISIIFFNTCYFSAFENVFFIPIIIACCFYHWKGFLYSCGLCLIYLLLIIGFIQDFSTITQTVVKVIFFIIIAGVIAFLAYHKRSTGEALHEIETRFHSLFESMHEGFAYCRIITDEQGKPFDFIYLKVNSAFEKISGLGRVEGRKGREIHQDLTVTNQELFGVYKRVAKTGIPEKIEITQKSGEGLLSVSVSCPQKGYFLGVYDNITGRRRSEDALKEKKTRISQIISRLPIPLCYVDSDNTIEFVNNRFTQTFGYSHLEIPTLIAFFEHAFPDEMYRQWVKHTWQRAVTKAKKTGSDIAPAEYTITCSNGDLKIIEISGITIEGNFLATFVDFTDRRRAEEAVREANQKLRFLTGITRHDIFNQLNAMYLYLDTALLEDDSDIIHEYVRKILAAGKRIEEITGFTREYENFGTDSSGWQNISRIIDSAQTEIPTGILTITNGVPKGLEVYADPIIRKVFTTLFDNAIRHGGENITRMELTVYEGENSITIICEDDGDGVKASEKDIIFANGYGKNTGIGLFLSREILAINGLSIKENGIENEGARFEILIPAGKFRNINKPDSMPNLEPIEDI